MDAPGTSGERGMQLDRRTMIAGAGAAIAAAPSLARGANRSAPWYSSAIVVDGLGGINDPYSPDDQLRLSDRGCTDYAMTRLTVVRDTTLRVGNDVDSREQFQKSLEQYHSYFAANPD